LARQGNTSSFADSLTRPYAGGRTDPVRLVARVVAVLSIGAGVIHVSAAGDHTNLPVMLVGFLVVAAVQIAFGGLLLWRRPSTLLLAGGIALMLGSVGVWLLSRTAGLPFLEDGHVEPVGLKDGVTVLFEVASIPAQLLLLSSELDRVRLPSPRLASQSFSFVGAACFALLIPAMLLGGGGHHTHEEAVELGIHEHADGDPAHAGSEEPHADGTDDHADDPRRSHAKGGHGHRDAAPGTDAHEHSTVQLANVPTAHRTHGGSGGTSTPHGGRDHADGDAEERHGNDHRERPEGHEDHPRRRDDDGEHEGGHGEEDPADDEEHGDDPEQPLNEILADVVALVPRPTEEISRRCARRQTHARPRSRTKRCARR